jgi:hypothetical protein
MFWNNLKGTIEYWWRRKKLTKEEQKKFDDFNYLDKSISFEDLKKDREKFINFFYSNPEEILHQIKLRKKIGFKFNSNFLSQDTIFGFLHRDVTPNIEINRMLGICDVLDIKPIFFDNPQDKFSSLSHSKYCMAKMGFLNGYNKNGELLYEYKKVVDFKDIEGKPLNSIKTFSGEDLISFHKNLFLKHYNFFAERNIFDISKFIKKNRAVNAYNFLFHLCLSEGILIENFVLADREAVFTEKIVYKQFLKVWKETKLKPIVVPCDPFDIENHGIWLSYVDELKRLML